MYNKGELAVQGYGYTGTWYVPFCALWGFIQTRVLNYDKVVILYRERKIQDSEIVTHPLDIIGWALPMAPTCELQLNFLQKIAKSTQTRACRKNTTTFLLPRYLIYNQHDASHVDTNTPANNILLLFYGYCTFFFLFFFPFFCERF